MDFKEERVGEFYRRGRARILNLTIDKREPAKRRGKARDFFEGKGYTVTEKEIPIGDFLFDNKVVFEYKKDNDMINSIKDGRVFRQSCRMSQYPYHYVIVVGDVFGRIEELWKSVHIKQSFTVNQYLGALASLLEDDKVVQVKNDEQAFLIMHYIADRHINQADKKVKSIDRPITKMTDSLSTFLTCIDGVGIKQAVLIKNYLHLESLEDLLNVEYEDLVGIRGVGDKTAKKILREIH